MRITTTPPVGAVQASQPVAKTDASRQAFQLPGRPADETRKTDGARPMVPTAGLDTLLAVQGMFTDDRRERRRKALKRGRDSLDMLDDLKVALISGDPIPAVLLKLRGITAMKQEASGDDGLDGVLAEIDLRAQVEIAKREAREAARQPT